MSRAIGHVPTWGTNLVDIGRFLPYTGELMNVCRGMAVNTDADARECPRRPL